MTTKLFNSIQARLTFWFLFLTLIPLLVVLSITYFQRVNAIQTSTFDKLTAIRDLKVERLNDWLTERAGDMYSIAEDNEFTDLEKLISKTIYNQNDHKILENSRRIINRYAANYQVYNEIFVINPNNGKILVSTNEHWEGDDRSSSEYYLNALNTKELSILDIYYSNISNSNAMVYSIPIFCSEHHGEHIAGILVARIDLKHSLYKLLLERVGLGETGETLIVNREAIALNELRWYDDAPLNLKISAEPAVNASLGLTGITKTTDYRNEKILAAYTHIPATGWGFVCKQDMYELNAPIREMMRYFIVIFIIVSIIIAVLALMVSKTISTPIVEMNNIARKIGSGDFSLRNKIYSSDELGSLAREFNNMADLTKSKLYIQQRVADISEIITRKTTLQSFGTSLLKQLMEISGAKMSTFYILNDVTSEFEHFTSVGANEDLLKSFNSTHPEGEFGNAVADKKIFHLKNISEDTIFKFRTTAGDLIPREIITIPLLADNVVVALISLVSFKKFSDQFLGILEQTFITLSSIYTNLMTNERTRILAEHLSKTNLQLEAKSIELQEQTEELQSQSEELQHTSEELQEQNQELEMQRIQVEEANRLKSEFLSNMSHELRTPLNSIMALSRVLIMQAKNKLTDEENNYLEIVERNGKQLLKLINDILDLSKIEAGRMDVNPGHVSLNTLLQNIKESLQPITLEKGLNFDVASSDTIPMIETDEAKLHQVLQNIISNAIKFTDSGKVQVKVDLDAENVFIEVHDTGIGIPEDALPHIFEEFRQVDGSSSRPYEGTGLGLAIAYKLIKILGGDITVQSNFGIGTTFTISLPVSWHGDAKLQDLQIIKPVEHEADKKTILVVDDDPKFVKYISDHLIEEGYKTISTNSGKKALELAEKYQPFAITLDVIMPVMDGWEVLQKLKNNAVTKHIPVIVVSVSEDNKTGFALGAVGFVQKPVDKYQLISEINKLHYEPNSVMIVDDNKIDLKHMSSIIQAENISTLLAGSGHECIKLLENEIPDVLVLDLMMPGMDGFQVLNKIRKDQKTRNLPVIVVTAKDLTYEDKTKLTGKVSSVLAKSKSTPQDLFIEIKRILSMFKKSGSAAKKKTAARILVVEDNEATTIQMRAILERENYIVDIASDGVEALEYVKLTIPDGIILDLMMPDVDGFEVLDNIRGTEATRLIPVLILTAKDLTKKDLSKLSANNIQQLVQKGDVDINGLLQKIKLMLGNENAESLKDRKTVRIEPGNNNRKITKKPAADLASILIVEDNPDNMTTIKAIIGKEYKIYEAVDGEEGLHKLVEEKPDLVLLDISLPKMDGMEVIRAVRETENLKNIPVVAVTARAMKQDKDIIMNAGFDDYITKPLDGKLLMNTIEKWLGNSQPETPK